MEKNPRVTKRGVEENTMAILDSSGVKDARDIYDDSLSFLEAVRGTSLVSETSSTVPTRRMCNAILQMFRMEEGSLEVVVACYQLLTELDQRYPRVYRSLEGGEGAVVVVKEAWSPFVASLENAQAEDDSASQSSKCLLDPHRFCILLQEIVKAVSQANPDLRMKPLKDMLLLEYLVNVLSSDFLPRHTGYKEASNWVLVRESLLNVLVCSRRLIFKGFIRDCLSIMYRRCHIHTGIDLHGPKGTENLNSSLAIAQSEIEQKTCISVQKLLILVMELDLIKKEADSLGYTSRADGVRHPALEIIVDELTYDRDLVSPFLQVFSEPKWKLEIILQYFWKYCSKPSVRTRASNKSNDNATFEGVLNYLSDSTNMKTIYRRITAEVAKLLLAHAFQAYLYLHDDLEQVPVVEGGSLLEICNAVVSAFQNLRKIDEDADILPLEKEAIFTAATILSMKT